MGEFRCYLPIQSSEWWPRLYPLRFLLCRHWMLLSWFLLGRAGLHVCLRSVKTYALAFNKNIVTQPLVRSIDGQLILLLSLPAFGACFKDGLPWVLG